MVCGVSIQKPRTCSLKDYSQRKYCSHACRFKSPETLALLKANGYKTATLPNSGRFSNDSEPWNKGKSNYLSEEARKSIGRATAERVRNETPEARKARMAKVIENRVKSGNWTPPALGKKGALRTNVWLGNEATYNGKHRWIQKNWVKTGTCDDCGKTPRPFGNRKYGTEWANLDGLYDREDRDSWKELCVKCHRALDKT